MAKERKCGFVSRRDFLFEAGGGLSGVALACLLDRDGLLAADIRPRCSSGDAPIDSPAAPKKPHFEPRAKAVISLFMSGGVSHVDTFDPKPDLDRYHGHLLEGKGEVIVRQGHPGPLMRTPFKFQKQGESGIEVSEIALGSWLTYGAGIEREHTEACTRAAFDAGINLFDTANIYGVGAAEAAWGEILKEYFQSTRSHRSLLAPLRLSDRPPPKPSGTFPPADQRNKYRPRGTPTLAPTAASGDSAPR